MGQSDDGAHSQNEKISKRNYILGVSPTNINDCLNLQSICSYTLNVHFHLQTKVFAAYLHEVSLLDKKDL